MGGRGRSPDSDPRPHEPQGLWDQNASFANGHDARRVAEYGMKDRTPVRITLTDVASALPDLVLAGTFALVWLDPSRPGLPSVRRLVMTVLLEFFIVHSSGFMGVIAIGNRSRSKAVWLTLGLGAFYTLFIGAVAIGSNDWWLLGSFWLLMANRLLGLVIGQAPDDRRGFREMAAMERESGIVTA